MTYEGLEAKYHCIQLYKCIAMHVSLAYTSKGCTPVEELPVLNSYTNSFVLCSCIICISI